MSNSKKIALIIGINGMVGSHMADFLLKKDYVVYGTVRNINIELNNVNHILNKITVLQADINDQNSLYKVITDSNPDEIYNFGAVSFAPNSWITPEYTANVNGLGVLRILEIIKQVNPNIRFYQAGTSEIFGNLENIVANELTTPYPKSPYGVAKLYAQWIIKNYRESYNLFACNGISFNHESERRGYEFVTKKITSGVAKIANGNLDYIELGNLNITRDWGYAPDYVEAMWLILQNNSAEDFIIATNKSHSIKYLLDIAFQTIGINNYHAFIKINPKFIRNNDIYSLRGDYSKINNTLGWSPKTSFEEMIQKMVKFDLLKK
jgi:GDPmannose 4,6-dehydratase